MMTVPTMEPKKRRESRTEEAPAPLFHRVQAALRQEILDGVYPRGSALPPEPELCARFQVSRITLRRAVDELVHEGLVYRRQGAGTFVAGARLNLELMELRGFQEELVAQGYEPMVTAMERRILPAPPEVAAQLGLSPNDPVIYLRRLLSSGGERLALARGYFPYRTCAALMDADPAASTYAFIEDELGLEIGYAEQTIEPQAARTEEARLLGIPRRALLLVIERVTYLTSGEPVHVGQVMQRADRYKLAMVLRRQRRRRASAPSRYLADLPPTHRGDLMR